MRSNSYTSLQLTALVILRFLIGWHLLFEGITKLITPGWSSIGFLRESQWILSDFSNWIASNSNVLFIVDFLNIWGLIAIGVSLILGLFGRAAAICGFILLFMYYLNSAPITGLEYSIPAEGSNLIVNKTLIEAVSLFILFMFPTSQIFGMDLLVNQLRKALGNQWWELKMKIKKKNLKSI